MRVTTPFFIDSLKIYALFYYIPLIFLSYYLYIIYLHRIYEALIGAIMTKTLGKTALQAAAIAASYFLAIPEENRPLLIADLRLILLSNMPSMLP